MKHEEKTPRQILEQKRLALCAALLLLARRMIHERRGQGTTEYAILVGVLVVIAIIAVVAFRGNIQALWESISNSINSL
ncbi:MAG: hypothetical protein LBC35_01315 [Coriobacteriales bacterium]|jgi:Flp pilus assembly pilin Flp|nr:hypothetical protein [Coriobacteriales bacterium]